MADQKAVSEAAGKNGATMGSVGEGVTDFVGDLVELAELQFRLLQRDAREGLDRAAPSLAALGLGASAIVSGMALALFGLAEELTALGILSRPSAFVTVGFAAVLIGAMALRFSLSRIASSTQAFRRTTEELVRNLAWVRTVLAQSGRARSRRS